MNYVTQILGAIDAGDPQAAQALLPLVYEELRKLAAARLAHEQPGQTLQATALVHEAYLRLLGPDDERRQKWDGRGHFFAAAAEAMRRILVENARRKGRVRHGGGRQRIDIEDASLAAAAPDEEVLAVHDALDALETADPQAAKLVKLHYFVGLPMAEVATLLSISERTAYRDWSFSRAWIAKYLAEN